MVEIRNTIAMSIYLHMWQNRKNISLVNWHFNQSTMENPSFVHSQVRTHGDRSLVFNQMYIWGTQEMHSYSNQIQSAVAFRIERNRHSLSAHTSIKMHPLSLSLSLNHRTHTHSGRYVPLTSHWPLYEVINLLRRLGSLFLRPVSPGQDRTAREFMST